MYDVIIAMNDDERLRNIVDAIQSDNYSVLAVTNGETAMRIMREDPPKVLVAHEFFAGRLGIDLIEAAAAGQLPGSMRTVLLIRNSSRGRPEGFPFSGIDSYVYWMPDTSFWQVVLCAEALLFQVGRLPIPE